MRYPYEPIVHQNKNGEANVSPFYIHLRVSDVLNGLGRALGSAGTAGQALVGNNKSHDIPSIQNNSDSGRAGSARHISLSELL